MLTTIIYADKKMTIRIFHSCLIMLLVSVIYRRYFGYGYMDDFPVADAVVAASIIIVTFFISNVLIVFQVKKNCKIADAYKHQMDMQKMIDKDPKTGLYNHTAFMNFLNESTTKCLEGEKPFSLAIIDIDNFKSVNDEFGHAQGDKVIIKLSEIMLKRCSTRQFPARFGGEEFAIIFDERSANNAFEIIEELREEFSKAQYEFTDKKITVSCGIAVWRSGWSSEKIFDNADNAMYTSKAQGKNQTTIYK